MSSSNVSAETLLAIQNVIADYCIALDDKDFELLRNVFTADTVADYSAVIGPSQDIHGVDSFIEKVGVVVRGSKTQHSLSTQRISFRDNGSGCDVRTYFQAHTFRTLEGEELSYTTFFGYYQDFLKEVEPKKWRILRREVKAHVSLIFSFGQCHTDVRF
jgi:hypothetical protein